MKSSSTIQTPLILPPNCPVRTFGIDRINPEDPDAYLTMGVAAEGLGEAVRLVAGGDRDPATIKTALGFISCMRCCEYGSCKKEVEKANNLGLDIEHPLDIFETLNPKDAQEIMLMSVFRHAQEAGYSTASIANVLGVIARQDKFVGEFTADLIKQDTSNFPKSAGIIELNGKRFYLIGFGKIDLALKISEVDEFEKGSRDIDGIRKCLINLFRIPDNTGLTVLRKAFEKGDLTGLNIKQFDKIQHNVMEFNAGTPTSARGFGKVLAHPTLDVVILDRIDDGAKSGGATKNREEKTGTFLREINFKTFQNAKEEAFDLGRVSVLKK